MGDSPSEGLGLIDAVRRWADSALIEKVIQHESACSEFEIASWIGPRLVGYDALRRPTADDWMAGGMDFRRLDAAWRNLDHQFKSQIECGSLKISGIPVKDGGVGAREPIDGALAMSLRFDYRTNETTLSGRKFISLRVNDRLTGDSASSELPPGRWRLRVQDVADLDDDVILALLEEHADRVVASKDPHFIVPAKVSLMPLIVRKMEARQRAGELAPTLGGEASALERWIATAVRGYQTPKAASISNHISKIYGALKA